MIVDSDQIYNKAIKPAIQECMPQALRGDEERTGEIIYGADVCAAAAIRLRLCRPQPSTTRKSSSELSRSAPKAATLTKLSPLEKKLTF